MALTRLATIAAFAGVDRDIAYALAARLVSAGGQLVTLSCVSVLMSPSAQGFHFTFLSFIAMQSFFELGFYVVIVNIAAHDWAALTIDKGGAVDGSARSLGRLADLLRFAVRWYALVSSIFLVVVLIGGWVFFSASPNLDISWQAPWTALVLFASLQIWINALLAFLEGCGQVANAYRMRVVASGFGQLTGWIVLAAGGELWIAPTIYGVTAFLSICLLARHHVMFFRSLMTATRENTLSWRSDIWPLQWRLGIQGLTAFFFFSIFTPVAFHYHGPIAAGQIGLSWSIANGVFSLFTSWMQARAPRLAMFIARNQDVELDHLFKRTFFSSTSALLLTLMVVWSILAALHVSGANIAQRFMAPSSLACLFCAAFVLQLSAGLSIYFRAHKQDPGTLLNLVTGIIVGCAIWTAGALATPKEMVTVFLVILLIYLPCQIAIFIHYRRAWHPTSPVPK